MFTLKRDNLQVMKSKLLEGQVEEGGVCELGLLLECQVVVFR